MASLHLLAQQVRDTLAQNNCRLVLAESCTAGNVAGALAVVPGISSWLCGSLVVYRNESKAEWLNVPRELLDDPQIGPVSSQVTGWLSRQALAITPEADLSAAVTGHIGPGCPTEMDGLVFFSMSHRHSTQIVELNRRLTCAPPKDSQDLAARQARLHEATQWVLESILLFEAHHPASPPAEGR